MTCDQVKGLLPAEPPTPRTWYLVIFFEGATPILFDSLGLARKCVGSHERDIHIIQVQEVLEGTS